MARMSISDIKDRLAATEADRDELQSLVLSVASEQGIYDGDCAESAIDCIRVALDGYSKLMWRIQRLCHADSAFPDDVFASVQKLVSTKTDDTAWRQGPDGK